MPVLEFLACAISGGFISQLTKLLVEFMWTTKCYIRYSVYQGMDKKNPIELNNENIIPHDSLLDIMVNKMCGIHGGIFVFAAPVGSGKSTLIKMAICKTIDRDPSFKIKLIKTGSVVFQNRDLHNHLKIPSNRAEKALSNYLPPKSIIIIDQIDMNTLLTDDLRWYLTGLAADSFNSGIYKIILCVSNAGLANDIIRCNGYQKFQRLCAFGKLKWSKEQAEKYISTKMPNISDVDKEKLISYAKQCGYSPGLLNMAVTYKGIFGDEEWTTLNEYTTFSEESWKSFDGEQS